MPQCCGPNNLGAFLREHGDLEGLAKWLGQHDPNAKMTESVANDNRPRKRVGLWGQFWTRLRRRDGQQVTR
jgi:hypothetical protein